MVGPVEVIIIKVLDLDIVSVGCFFSRMKTRHFARHRFALVFFIFSSLFKWKRLTQKTQDIR